jgi:CHAT domain-containing protein/tetratricopeptide (TPR) repeat protein
VFYEKALEMARRLLTHNHPRVAFIYDNVATNLNRQGKFAEAQPVLEKALAIYVRQLTENHPLTANAYNDLAMNLYNQGKFTQAQPLLEKGLELRQHLLTDDHSLVAESYENLAMNLAARGEYARAEPLLEKSLAIYRRLLTDGHLKTTIVTSKLASDLAAQGKYTEARDRWLAAARSMDKARLRFAFTGLERAGGNKASPRPALAAVQARLGRPAEAWQSLEEDLGRGLLDELAARRDRRITAAERDRLRELTAELERLDRLVGTTPKGLDQAGRAQRFEELTRRRELASIALGEFQARLVREHDALAGEVAGLGEIQAALPADAALVAWVDIPPAGPNAAGPDGEHWGVVVRSKGAPAWIPIAGTGPDGLWTEDDVGLAAQVRAELRRRPGASSASLRTMLDRLRARRLGPLDKALQAEGQPPVRRLIALPSRAMAGIPIEALLAPDDARTVSYAPSATVFKLLREQPRPERHAGLLALGDPAYGRRDGSVAARAGDRTFDPLPGSRSEVEAIARLFRADGRPVLALLAAEAGEPELDRLAASGELGRFGFIHLATHGLIDEGVPQRSAVILTQVGLPDPLEQVLHQRPAYDGQLSVREIQRGWELKAELVTLSACETALGREAGGEGFVGFVQALLMSGTRSVCLSLWEVDDTATALLMARFYDNLLGHRAGLAGPMPKAEALRDAKTWMRGLRRAEAVALSAALSGGALRGKGAKARPPAKPSATIPAGADHDRPYAEPHFWAAFVLAGDPD